MAIELGFTPEHKVDRYSIALLMFFVTYFIFEIPSNIVLRKMGAANWLSFLCFSWGVVILGKFLLCLRSLWTSKRGQ